MSHSKVIKTLWFIKKVLFYTTENIVIDVILHFCLKILNFFYTLHL